MEPAEPIDRTDPADPMERTEPLDPMDRIEALEPTERIDRERGRATHRAYGAPAPSMSNRWPH